MTPTLLEENIKISTKWKEVGNTKPDGFIIGIKSEKNYPDAALQIGTITETGFIPTGRSSIIPTGFEVSGQFRVEYAFYRNGSKLNLTAANLKNIWRFDTNSRDWKELLITTDTTIWVEPTKDSIRIKMELTSGEIIESIIKNAYIPNNQIYKIHLEFGIETGVQDLIIPIERHVMNFSLDAKDVASFVKYTNLPLGIYYRVKAVESINHGWIEASDEFEALVSIDLNISEIDYSETE